MSITLSSHYTLRNIPWEVLITKCIRPWSMNLKMQNPWSLLERTSRFLNSDGKQDQLQFEFAEKFPLDILGFDQGLSYKDGSSIQVRFTASRLPEGNVVASLYTTLDLASGRKMKGDYLSLHQKLKEFSVDGYVEETQSPKLHFGEEPLSVFLQTSRGSLWKHIADHPKGNPVIPYNLDNSSKEDSLSEESVMENSKGESSKEDASRLEHSAMESSIPENSETEYSKLQAKIKQLEESLEETVNENNALTEQLEDSQIALRKLQNDKKIQNRTINELKDKNERIKKRMKQADKRANMNADEKFSKFCEDFDKENDELRANCIRAEEQRDTLQQKLREAEGKITSLKGRLAKALNGMSGGLMTAPDEREKLDDEFGIAIISALHKAIEKTPSKSNSYGNRPIDVWKAIIAANPEAERAFQNYKEVKEQLMDAMKSNDLERNFHLLPPLGMTHSSHTNNHWKLTFADGDRRYNATHASTPSETAAGPSNSAKDLKNAFLYPT